MLNKRGISSTRERISLLQRFIVIFGAKNIAGLLADREFIGEKWFNWLGKNGINFHIRIKGDAVTHNKNGKAIDVSWLFYHLKSNEQLFLTKFMVASCVYLQVKLQMAI